MSKIQNTEGRRQNVEILISRFFKVPHTSHLTPHTSSAGFTLIETLVAITILIMSLSGPLALAAQALSSAYYARDQISAFYLAQEAVEYVRAKRDQNYLVEPQQNWLSGLEGCVDALCNVDFANFTHTICVTTCEPLLYNESTGLYNTQSGNASIFRRELTIESSIDNPDKAVVRVQIFWKTRNIQRSFEIRETIFNWL